MNKTGLLLIADRELHHGANATYSGFELLMNGRETQSSGCERLCVVGLKKMSLWKYIYIYAQTGTNAHSYTHKGFKGMGCIG